MKNETDSSDRTETTFRNLRENVRRLRNALGWSQAELARRAELEPAQISRLESGKHVPDIPTLDKIAEALSVKTARLFEPDIGDPHEVLGDLFQTLDNAMATATRVKLSLQGRIITSSR